MVCQQTVKVTYKKNRDPDTRELLCKGSSASTQTANRKETK